MKLYSHLFVVIPVLIGFAAAKQDTNDSLARVGTTTISRSHVDAFSKVIRTYPSKPNDYFPGNRSEVTSMIESEILASKATPELKSALEKSADWQWKKMYYPAQFYLLDNLVQNLGATDGLLQGYYKAHKESYKVIIPATDSLKKDSSYYRSFDEAKDDVATAFFLQVNKPDSAFLKSLGDTLPPEKEINQNWIGYVRSNVPQYFMKKFYKEDYGKTYTDSINDIFGDGKLITQKDFDVILSWIPEERREYYSNDRGKKELVEWLLKWKIFSNRAEKSGFTKLPIIKNSLDWAWKLEVASQYVTKTLVSKVKKTPAIDTLMVKYALTDESGIPNLNPDTTQLYNKINSIKLEDTVKIIDSLIYDMRKKAGVKFLTKDWHDELTQDPVKLIAKADMLRDSAKADEAEQLYSTLSNNFSFTTQGKRAIIELAKIQTERQSYYQAITNYRKYLITGDDKSKFCNVFFMIGFIYDEYLDKPELAESNYKYVLKNIPGCELTDDAEFMMLHLGEPMSSVEELQAEALRQGRKIETAETTTSK